jgi:hypothetical protein
MGVGHVCEGLEPVLEAQVRHAKLVHQLGLLDPVETCVVDELEVGVLEGPVVDVPQVDASSARLEQALRLANDRVERQLLGHACQSRWVGGLDLPGHGAGTDDEFPGEEYVMVREILARKGSAMEV